MNGMIPLWDFNSKALLHKAQRMQHPSPKAPFKASACLHGVCSRIVPIWHYVV